MSQVSVRDLWMQYPNQMVLERINLEIRAGEFCALVGPSGCGKTTFLRLLLGEESPSRGRIEVAGRPLVAEPGPDRGVVFQRYSVFPHLTVLDNVIIGREFRGARFLGRLFGSRRRAAIDDAKAVLDEVGLTAHLGKYPAELSGGMQQRLAIAQAVMMKPKVLLLDEPFGALDPGTRAQMHELLLRLWEEEKMTVFMVTHDLKEGFKLATRVLVFDKVRLDPTDPGAYGATITYDLPLDAKRSPSGIAALIRNPDLRRISEAVTLSGR